MTYGWQPKIIKVKSSMLRERYAKVIPDVAAELVLDYAIPEALRGKILPGSRVAVPLKQRLCHATVVELTDTSEYAGVKEISQVVETSPLPDDLLKLATWMARYYATPLWQIIKQIMPAAVRKDVGHKEQYFVRRARTLNDLREHIPLIRHKAPSQAAALETMLKVKVGILLTELIEKSGANRTSIEALQRQGWLTVEMMAIDRCPLEGQEYFITAPKALNAEQEKALYDITQALERAAFHTHLLYGITGSGKTEVYLQAIEKALQHNRSAIFIVPEIALTTQTIERLRSRFKDNLALLHSGLSEGERYDAWQKMSTGQAPIAIGARSAIFAPLPNLGLIIVDEEHDPSYKQTERMPCYHARDVAVMRGKLAAASVILGSATPSLESYYNATKGKYSLSVLSQRADSARLPRVTIVDMKREYEQAQGRSPFSQTLLEAIDERLKRGEQSILFLNRRGYHTFLLCQECGESVKCRHCDTAMTFHKGENNLSCHLCGYMLMPPPRSCPRCRKDATMKFRGIGTELVEKSLQALFPEARTLRLDADTTRHKGSHEKLLRAFGSGKADVLIGTQMIAKGLHFPEVTLAAILNGDSALHIPDFRAAESTFHLLTQVAGRAGRGVVAGEVLIQTSLPDHEVIQRAAHHDFEGFYKAEIAARALFSFPPFAQLVKVTGSASSQPVIEGALVALRRKMAALLPADFILHPVVGAAHLRVKDRFRYQFLIRGPTIYPIVDAYRITARDFIKGDIRLTADVNPMTTFF